MHCELNLNISCFLNILCEYIIVVELDLVSHSFRRNLHKHRTYRQRTEKTMSSSLLSKLLSDLYQLLPLWLHWVVTGAVGRCIIKHSHLSSFQSSWPNLLWKIYVLSGMTSKIILLTPYLVCRRKISSAMWPWSVRRTSKLKLISWSSQLAAHFLALCWRGTSTTIPWSTCGA